MKNEEQDRSKIAKKEEEILKFWQENKIFKKTLEKKSSKGNFVFYDGPPFATGEPHYGHVLAGTIKDVIPRYKTMQGYFVRRTWGWDCHGLPIENMIEKELGLKSKKDIEEYGIEKFNKAARDSVLLYEELWKNFIPRVGRWVDMENAYKTMDASYTESVWWSFKNLYEKSLVYEGFKVMPYCPHCGTTLSNFEVNLGYKDISDISVYVKFKVLGEENLYLLAWTTTPWTLPGNVALAVGEDMDYVEIEKIDEGGGRLAKFILAKERLLDIFGNDKLNISRELKGKDLVGLEYEPIFDYYSKDGSLKNRENGWRVYAGNFVTTEEGTGIVHMSPAFGSDDYDLSKKENLPFVQHVDMEGKMKTEVKDFALMMVKPKTDNEKERLVTDIEIIKYLQGHGAFFGKKKINHSYPHCWRCDTPLLNYATSSWFVKVTDLKDKIINLNKEVKWVPAEIGENRFGKWLEGARDWGVSRSRYWGASIPVWRNKDREIFVMGSVADLKQHTKKSGNKYFVMRHGEGEHNVSGIVSARKDDPVHLTEKGQKEVEESSLKLKDKKIDVIYASPFVRTKETVSIILNTIGLKESQVIYESRLGEFDARPVSNQKFSFYEYFKNLNTFDQRMEEGESPLDVKKRIAEFLYEIDQKHQGQNILIITHGIFFGVIDSIINGSDQEESLNTLKSLVGTIKTGSVRDFEFVYLPHNENYELDLHRPFIDRVELIDEKGNKLERVKEVFDTWYDSGSMPYAQTHYPFKNKDEFENTSGSLFPAHFIAEGLDQTRGWFYTLLVLNVGLFDKSPYQNVLVNGIILAEDGQKMSKRLKNYPDPMDIINKYGADALRYYMLSSPVVRSEDLTFSERGLDEVYKKIVLKLENIFSFYDMYTRETELEKASSKNVLDLWIIARLNQMGEEITKNLEGYRLDLASRPILDFIDDLSTWYIRRSRDRFKSDDLEDKKNALGTTKFVLMELSKYMAPFMPFFAESIYLKLKEGSDPESVHLCSWPKVDQFEEKVLENMAEARNLASLALEKRNEVGIKVRQPLQMLKVKSDKLKGEEEYLDLLKDEVNLKSIVFDSKMGGEIELDTEITTELKREGEIRDFIRKIQELRKENSLTPDQKIIIRVETDKEGEDFVKLFESKISKPTNIIKIEYSKNSGKEFILSEMKFKIEFST